MTLFKTTEYYEINHTSKVSKYADNQTAVCMNNMRTEPSVEGVSCKHHICVECMDRLITDCLSETDDDDLEIKCPLCRCKYDIDEMEINNRLDYARHLADEGEKEEKEE